MEPKEQQSETPKIVITSIMIERAAEAYHNFRDPTLSASLSAFAYDEIRMAHALAAAINR